MNHSVFHHLLVLAFVLLTVAPSLAADSLPPAAAPALEDTLNTSPRQQQPEANPYANLPQEYIDEASAYYAECERTFTMRQYYNCKCWATAYLDKRIELGPDSHHDNIRMAIQHDCIDATAAAGYEYEQCLNNGTIMPQNIAPEEYCSCYANTYAKLFEMVRASPNSQVFMHLQTQAYIACKDPELAERLFPIKIPN